MPHAYWYEVINDQSLRQGDVFQDLEVFWVAPELGEDGDVEAATVQSRTGRWIVALASCDMQARGFEQILVVPVLPATRELLKIPEAAPEKEYRKRLEVIRKGLYARRFLLPERPEQEDGVGLPLSMAAWDTVAIVPSDYLRANANAPRLRLRSPFREQFGNWLGEKLSAVGPEDDTLIKPFYQQVHDAHVLSAQDALAGDEG